MTQAKITITRTRRGLGFPDTQRYVKRAAAAALKAEGVTVPPLPEHIYQQISGIFYLSEIFLIGNKSFQHLLCF